MDEAQLPGAAGAPDARDAPDVPDVLPGIVARDPSVCLAVAALLRRPDEQGTTPFGEAAVIYREDYLAALRQVGGGQLDAGTLSMDAVRSHLATSVFPRLVTVGLIDEPSGGWQDDTPARLRAHRWAVLRDRAEPAREQLIASAMQLMLTHGARPDEAAAAAAAAPHGSRIEGIGLSKSYGGRTVVNDVSVSLAQGEIVGMLGPNGAGKTTTFYMLVGLIAPDAGRIMLDGHDISREHMYRRARKGTAESFLLVGVGGGRKQGFVRGSIRRRGSGQFIERREDRRCGQEVEEQRPAEPHAE